MSLVFLSASSQSMTTTSPPVTSPAFTVCFWFKPDNTTGYEGLFTLGNSGADDQFYHAMLRGADVGDPIRLYVAAGGDSQLDTTSGYSSGTWQHLAMVVNSTSARSIWLDSDNENEETGVTRSVTGINQMSVGSLKRISEGLFFNGRIAHLAIWDRALTTGAASEVEGLAGGDNPLAVQAADLVYYNTFLTTSSVDVIGALSLTNNNSVTDNADMPTVDAPPATGPAAGILLNHLRTQGIS
jgi:hypothetical protein